MDLFVDVVLNSFTVSIALIFLLGLIPFYYYNQKVVGFVSWLLGLCFFIVFLSFQHNLSIILLIIISSISGAFAVFYNYALKIPKVVHDCGFLNVMKSFKDTSCFKTNNKKLIDKNKKDELDLLHVGIIIAKRKGFLREMDKSVYADGIDLLIEFLLRRSIQFNIYECGTPQSAKDVINNPLTCGLFIFGHGTKCSLYFGRNGLLNYCEVRTAPKKKIIAQLHCNSNEECGCSLADYILDDDGIKFIIDGYRCIHQNRTDIESFISDHEEDIESFFYHS